MEAIEKLDLLPKEESYDDRRKLFKNIWETAMTVDDKDDNVAKTKIIKTLRLDEEDKSLAIKQKKQRIKNLRHVCTKILDFCDRQDSEDVFYEQMEAEVDHISTETPPNTDELQGKKTSVRKKRKVKKTKSMYAPYSDTAPPKAKVSESKETRNFGHDPTKTSKNTSTFRMTRTPRVRISAYKVELLDPKSSGSDVETGNDGDTKTPSFNRRSIKRKLSKRKKIPDTYKPPGLNVRTRILNYDLLRTRAWVNKNKEPVQLTSLMIT